MKDTYTKAKIGKTKDDLETLLSDYGWIGEALEADHIIDELGCVSFDTEDYTDPDGDPFNMPGFIHGWDTAGGIPILWIGAGGDWEKPVAFCLYIGADDDIHAYVPEKGNAYDHARNRAFTDDGESTPEAYEFNMDLMRKEFIEKVGKVQ